MTITEPLPVSGYGKADWVDYSNYWREADSEWLMERSVLRYANTTLRTTQYPTPKFGQITYNEQAINLGGGTTPTASRCTPSSTTSGCRC